MESKFEDRKIFNLQIEADMVTGYDEITPFFSAMKKLSEKAKRPGFVREFNKNERIVLKAIWDDLKTYEFKNGNN